jgi:hypothetical protein
MILAFLHTSPIHIPTFENITQSQAPHTPTLHRVEEALLAQARAEGITPALEGKVHQVLLELVAQGAKVIVCTCSTLGGIAETAQVGCTVLRVDRAMAQKALELGDTILLVAALESTLEPTRNLFIEVAEQAHQKVELLELCCKNAWVKFEAGNKIGVCARNCPRNHSSGSPTPSSEGDCFGPSLDDGCRKILPRSANSHPQQPPFRGSSGPRGVERALKVLVFGSREKLFPSLSLFGSQ